MIVSCCLKPTPEYNKLKVELNAKLDIFSKRKKVLDNSSVYTNEKEILERNITENIKPKYDRIMHQRFRPFKNDEERENTVKDLIDNLEQITKQIDDILKLESD